MPHDFRFRFNRFSLVKTILPRSELPCFLMGMNTPKKIEIELSDSASAVIAEMGKRGKVKPEALARICVENTLSQAIDYNINGGEGDIWLLENARDPKKACRESWEEVKNPGSYAAALERTACRRRQNG